MTSVLDQASDLVRQALDIYEDDPIGRDLLQGLHSRLEEPLRVAVAGMIKAGKSTLINAIIGEEIAPTDAGESTRIVTWYRFGATPRITVHLHDGAIDALPVRRVGGRLVLDTGGRHAADIARLVVDWPSRQLRDITIIDTPGIASLSEDVSQRSLTFLTPVDAPSEADAIVYMMRHLHASDLNFLEAFKDSTAGRSATINALAVLSRADEIGSGRIDSLLSAGNIADRYRREGVVQKLALEILPLAGLLAQSSRTLRQSEFSALQSLSSLERPELERLLLSADRFLRPDPRLAVSPEIRAELLNRFGLFGVRLASALIRAGCSDASTLARQLTRRSGLDELLAVVSAQFQARADHLKARSALLGIGTLLRQRPRAGTSAITSSLERLEASDHEFRELRLLADLRSQAVVMPNGLNAEAEALIGGHGVGPSARLGAPDDAQPEVLLDTAMGHLRRWRSLAQNPLTYRETAEACQVVVRSCEAVLHSLRSQELLPARKLPVYDRE
ncbi:GTP-binding protein [Arthrobacter sp. NamB2]|uniref:dynamin family protein n=1 Tax=Arthrobacter sp. NamB2 TaxID=2576035 RepID=UPI0010C94423|nr:dynamin family protein [Arthrobacter sp. NamB2]TKV27822.1 GTP-binding protein [Arthrobacter sp. NamB2]